LKFSSVKNFGETNDFGETGVNQNVTKTRAKRGALKKETPQTVYLRGSVLY
jgi:hypothetical protein